MNDTIFQPLLNCQDALSLENAISDNIDQLAQWAKSKYSALLTCRMPLRQLVQVKGNLLAELDFSNSANRACIVLLHDVCCAINLSGPATVLYNIIQNKRLVLGCRLEAAMMVLQSYGSNDDFVEIFVPLCEKLQFAIQNEEDDESRCIAVFIRFYALVVRDLHNSYVSLVQNRIAAYKSTYHFLNNDTIHRASSISSSDKQEAYIAIINMLADVSSETEIEDSNATPSVTNASEFSSRLPLCDKNFRSIRELACQMLSERDFDEDEVFRSLGRGVRVLTNEDQLLVYLMSYGAMHEAKLRASYEQFNFDSISSTVRIIDWGCGQAVATMCLLEYIQEHGIDINVEEIILIEPSSVALRRAEIFVHHFNSNVAIKNINKGFDELVISDLDSLNECETIHLFSNVLDYDGYDINHLQNVISASMSNVNYFICVSPYINEIKVNRINSFEQYFSNFQNYRHIYDVNNLAGTWIGKWTRVIRVFSIEI